MAIEEYSASAVTPHERDGAPDVEHFEATLLLGIDRARLALRGELDLAAADVLADCLDQARDGDEHRRELVLIDISELTYCDSSGIRTLLGFAAWCERNDTRLRVVGAQGAVRRVFEIANVVESLGLDRNDD